MIDRTQSHRLLMVGLPGSGKSTFLAALWYAVECPVSKGGLVVAELGGESIYLNSLRDRWLTCQELERTPSSAAHVTRMHLRREPEGTIVDIALPDLSGELFNRQWVERSWDSRFLKLATQATGVLLFLHSTDLVEPQWIAELDALARVIGPASAPPVDGERPEWNAHKSPTQVKIVDLLQFLSRSGEVSLPIKLAVVVSAWDLVSQVYSDPTVWLRKRVPLLSQFLAANDDAFRYATFGISAQGGRLPLDADALLNHIEQLNRIRVVYDGAGSNDIASPVKWILE